LLRDDSSPRALGIDWALPESAAKLQTVLEAFQNRQINSVPDMPSYALRPIIPIVKPSEMTLRNAHHD